MCDDWGVISRKWNEWIFYKKGFEYVWNAEIIMLLHISTRIDLILKKIFN